MAWTDPRTWSTGEVVTAAHLNTHVRDNLRSVLHQFDYSASDVEVVSTVTETSVWSKSITGGALGSSGELVLRLDGDVLYNNSTSDTLRIRVKFGGVTVIDGATTLGDALNAARRAWLLRVEVANRAATNAQLVTAYVAFSSTSTALTAGTGSFGSWAPSSQQGRILFGQNTAAIDTTTAQTLDVTAQWSASSANNAFRKRKAVLLLGQH